MKAKISFIDAVYFKNTLKQFTAKNALSFYGQSLQQNAAKCLHYCSLQQKYKQCLFDWCSLLQKCNMCLSLTMFTMKTQARLLHWCSILQKQKGFTSTKFTAKTHLMTIALLTLALCQCNNKINSFVQLGFSLLYWVWAGYQKVQQLFKWSWHFLSQISTDLF